MDINKYIDHINELYEIELCDPLPWVVIRILNQNNIYKVGHLLEIEPINLYGIGKVYSLYIQDFLESYIKGMHIARGEDITRLINCHENILRIEWMIDVKTRNNWTTEEIRRRAKIIKRNLKI